MRNPPASMSRIPLNILTNFVDARNLFINTSFEKPTNIVIIIINTAIATEYTRKIRIAFPNAPASIDPTTNPNSIGRLHPKDANA